KQARDRRPRGPQHPVSDVRPRASEPCEDCEHNHAVRRRPRSVAPTQFASGRGSALRPSRPLILRLCPRQAISTGLKAKRGAGVEGTLPDVPPIPRCETALREKSAGYRSNFPSLPTVKNTCLYRPLDPAGRSEPGRVSVEKTRNRFRSLDRTIWGAKSNLSAPSGVGFPDEMVWYPTIWSVTC